jgi:hypothetical protein
MRWESNANAMCRFGRYFEIVAIQGAQSLHAQQGSAQQMRAGFTLALVKSPPPE